MKTWVDRADTDGITNKAIAIDLDVEHNNLSMWKLGYSLLPLSRVVAEATDAPEGERKELLIDRLLELHGQKTEMCLETVVQFAVDWAELHAMKPS